MKKTILISCLLLTGCASTIDPTLVPGVQRKDENIYTVSELHVGSSTIDKAVQQCKLDGNKRLNIMANTQQTGVYSGDKYAVVVFSCDGK